MPKAEFPSFGFTKPVALGPLLIDVHMPKQMTAFLLLISFQL
jgi:hypothetical protein